MPRIWTLDPVKLVWPGQADRGVAACDRDDEEWRQGIGAAVVAVSERQVSDAAGPRDRRHAEVVGDVAGRGAAGDGERRGIGGLLAALVTMMS